MGQGIYTMIGYGTTKAKLPIDDNGYVMELDRIFGKDIASRLKTSYECEPFYLMIPIAVSDKFLSNVWGIKCFARKSFSILDIQNNFAKEITLATMTWLQVLNCVKKTENLIIPHGEILIVNDWD